MMVRYISGFVVVLMLVVAGCGSGDEIEVDDAHSVIKVESFAYVRQHNGRRVLRGDLFNTTDRRIENAQINVSLYDADNRKISQMIIPVKDVEPHGRTAFEQVVSTDLEVQGAKVRSIIMR